MLWIALYLPQFDPSVSPSPREQAAHAAAHVTEIRALANWAGRFTFAVSPEEDCGLLLEVEGSLRLFGGLKKLVAAIRCDLSAMRLDAQLAAAPTPRAAWWMAKAGCHRFCADPAQLRRILGRLPLAVLGAEKNTARLLCELGLQRIGDLLALPRDGVALRCGPELLAELDRALGSSAEARRFHTPPPVFDSRLELPAEIEDVATLAFALKRLVLQLGGFLAARNGAIRQSSLYLEHREDSTLVPLGLVAPSRDIEHLLRLLREHLERVRLRAPVRALRLEAKEILDHGGSAGSLFQDDIERNREWPKLVEQLRARLGAQNVQGLRLQADHRPEAASVACEIDAAGPDARFAPRPLWLLPVPQALCGDALPQHEGPLKLLSGPERIRSGWWDGRPAARDYFVAQNEAGALLWIYRETGRVWFLHGWFA
jgi:protein ImuB